MILKDLLLKVKLFMFASFSFVATVSINSSLCRCEYQMSTGWIISIFSILLILKLIKTASYLSGCSEGASALSFYIKYIYFLSKAILKTCSLKLKHLGIRCNTEMQLQLHLNAISETKDVYFNNIDTTQTCAQIFWWWNSCSCPLSCKMEPFKHTLFTSLIHYETDPVTQWYRIHLQCKRHGFESWVGKIP